MSDTTEFKTWQDRINKLRKAQAINKLRRELAAEANHLVLDCRQADPYTYVRVGVRFGKGSLEQYYEAEAFSKRISTDAPNPERGQEIAVRRALKQIAREIYTNVGSIIWSPDSGYAPLKSEFIHRMTPELAA